MLTFKNGIHPYEGKELSKNKEIKEINPDKEVVFPMSQHLGTPANPVVKVGDSVLVGQIIGEASGTISANVLSSVSGVVKSIENREIIGGNSVMSIVVENDEKYNTIDGFGEEKDYKSLSNEEVLNIIKNSGIVGLGGAGFPTNVKLMPKDPDKIDYVIVNGAECEPYLTSDYRLMLEETDMLIKGLEVMLKVLPKAKGLICIEDNKMDAYNLINEKLKNNLSISTCLLKTKYPQGGERQIIYAATGRKINSKMLPADVGVIVDNVNTVVAIAYAVTKSSPLVFRHMTLSGDSFNETGNYKVRLGISYKELLDKCGGFKTEPKMMISGGPMMGMPLYNLEIPVSKASSAFLAFNNDPKDSDEETHCISCGKCVDSCPVLLTPNKMLVAAKRNDFETYINLNGQECISCGCCSYVCPAKKPLTPYFQYMKANMRKYLDSRKEVK